MSVRTLAVQVRKTGGLSKVSIHWHPGEKICMLFSIFWCQLSSVVLSRKVMDHILWSFSEEILGLFAAYGFEKHISFSEKVVFFCFVGHGVQCFSEENCGFCATYSCNEYVALCEEQIYCGFSESSQLLKENAL